MEHPDGATAAHHVPSSMERLLGTLQSGPPLAQHPDGRLPMNLVDADAGSSEDVSSRSVWLVADIVALVAVLRGDSNVKGTVTFEQENESSPTTITWDITGHDANAERGMHVHAFGDNTNGCTSAGPHCMCTRTLDH